MAGIPVAARISNPVYCDRALGRFFAKTELTPNGCWPWTGRLDSGGYARIGIRGASRRAHRWFYEYLNGALGALQTDHLCRNRACVNPAHLEPVTNWENHSRGLHGDLRASCPHGHPFPESQVSISGKRRCGICVKLQSHKSALKVTPAQRASYWANYVASRKATGVPVRKAVS